MNQAKDVGSAMLASYEGFEDPSKFADAAAVRAYEASLIERTEPQAALIAQHAAAPRFTMLEACSGNGRLLNLLAKQDRLVRGEGWEFAQSRVAFAQRWAKDLGVAQRVRHVKADALRPPAGDGPFDVAACITGALGYFDVFEKDGSLRLLKNLRTRQAKGGLLVVEAYMHPQEVAWCRASPSSDVRLWRELPPSDPWRFYLSHLSWSEADKVLTHRKVFVHRTTGQIDDARVEALRIWDEKELRALLKAAGYEVESIADGWAGKPFKAGVTDVAVVVARAA